MSEASAVLAGYVRSEAGRLVASLTREFGDFDLAEESVQDAVLAAIRHWPTAGIPRQPGAWLRVTARRKALDRLRRTRRERDCAQRLSLDENPPSGHVEAASDDRLVLIFMCCHPRLSRDAQLALTLRSVLGLTTAQLATAFLVSEATMTQRIVRAKRKIATERIPFAMPPDEELSARLGEVLAALYLMFNEGYLSAGPAASQRDGLADDAAWLADLLLELVPAEPEVIGLNALIRLQQARRAARFDRSGNLVVLKDQDRGRWDWPAIDGALALLNGALRIGQPGPYQVQAAIVACHARARRWPDTDWTLIVALYDQLLELTASPVVALNRAIALLYRDGPEAALVALQPLVAPLGSYHLFHAAKAEMLRRLGDEEAATDEDRAASRLTGNPAELWLLEHRIGGAAFDEVRQAGL